MPVKEVLGKEITVVSESVDEFAAVIDQYTRASCVPDDDNLKGIQSLAPIISKISVYGRWPILKTGLTLLDLPGTNDANTRRNTLSRSHLQSADLIWICVSAERAASNRSARGIYTLQIHLSFSVVFFRSPPRDHVDHCCEAIAK